MERTNEGELPTREDAHVRAITRGDADPDPGSGGTGPAGDPALGRTGGGPASGRPEKARGGSDSAAWARPSRTPPRSATDERGNPVLSTRKEEGGDRTRTGPGAFTPADEERRRGRAPDEDDRDRALLLVATVVYVLAKWAEPPGAGGWAGYVAAAAEAGMVGALADWFAVTALFRRPMGLPIPHTAIIPTKKDAAGPSLGDFVGENFLSADVVRTRLRAVGIGARLGAWLAEPDARRPGHRAERPPRCAARSTVLRDSDVQAVVGEADHPARRRRRRSRRGWARLLEKVVADGGHQRMVDLVCVRAARLAGGCTATR